MIALVKWGLKAVGGLLANLALLTFWVEWVGLPPWLAIAPNFLLISVAGYAVANWWIWPEGVTPATWRGHLTQYVGMQVANLGGKVANYLLYLGLIPLVDYRVAWLVGAVVTFLLTFVLNRAWWTRSAIAERA
jgi:putative flippase GtrA